jgi:PAS domain S-box-containing protein
MSPSVKNILGYSNEEVIEMSPEESNKLFHPNDLEELQSFSDDLIEADEKGQKHIVRSFRMLTKEQEVRHISGTYTLKRDFEGSPLYIIGNLRDITSDIFSENELKKATEIKDYVLNGASVGICYLSNRKLVWANKPMEKMFGYDHTKFINKDIDFIYKSEAEYQRVGKLYEKKSKNINTVVEFKKKSGEIFFGNLSINIVNQNEKSLDAIVSITDISDLIEVKGELKEVSEKFQSFSDLLPEVVFEVNTKGEFIYLNKVAFEKLKLDPNIDYTEINMFSLFHPDDLELLKKNIQSNLQGNRISGTIYRLLDTDKNIKYFQIHNSVVSQNGNPVGLRGIAVDVSEKIKTENQILEQEKELEIITSNAPNVIWKADIDKEGQFTNTYISSVVDEFLGLESGSIGNSWNKYFNYVEPEYLPLIQEKIAQGIAEPKKIITFEYQVKKADGETVWFQSSGRAYPQKDVVRIYGYTSDITERKKAEIEIKEKEEQIKLFGENINDIMWLMDENLKLTFVSPSVEKLLGHKPVDVINSSFESMLDKESGKIVKKAVENRLRNVKENKFDIQNKYYEVNYKHKNGNYIPYEVTVTPLYDDNKKFRGVVAINKDISKRKEAEEKLKFHSMLLSQISDLVTATDLDGNITYVNKSNEELTGYKKEELIGKNVSIYGEDPDIILQKDLVKQVLQNGFWEGEVVNFDKNGKKLELESNLHVIKDEKGVSTGIIGISRDISEKKKALQKLKESEEKFRSLFNVSPDIIAVLDKDLKVLEINDVGIQELGYSKGEIVYSSINEVQIDLKEEDFIRIDNELAEKGNVVFENRFKRKDGSIFPVLVHLKVIQYEGKMAVLSQTRNIAAIKENERKIKEISDRLTLATKSAQIGIWELNLVSNQLTWDDKMFDLYGIEEENFGKAYETWKQGLHPDDMERSEKEVQMALKGEKEFNTEFRVITPKGELRYLRAFATVSRDQDGKPLKMTGINYNITQRKTAEKELLESEERFRLIFELAESLIGIANLDSFNFTIINPAFEKLLGYTKEEILSQSYINFLHPEDVQKIKRFGHQATSKRRKCNKIPKPLYL